MLPHTEPSYNTYLVPSPHPLNMEGGMLRHISSVPSCFMWHSEFVSPTPRPNEHSPMLSPPVNILHEKSRLTHISNVSLWISSMRSVTQDGCASITGRSPSRVVYLEIRSSMRITRLAVKAAFPAKDTIPFSTSIYMVCSSPGSNKGRLSCPTSACFSWPGSCRTLVPRLALPMCSCYTACPTPGSTTGSVSTRHVDFDCADTLTTVAIICMHHTHPAVPHCSGKAWTFIRGAMGPMDRSFGFIGPHFFHNFIEHYVIHHLSPRVPFYRAEEATNAIKPLLRGGRRGNKTS